MIMRKAIKFLVLATMLLLCIDVTNAASTQVFGSLITVPAGTTNSPGFQVGTFSLPGGYYLIQNGGLTTTNAVTIYYQVSVDNTNFITYGLSSFTVTNAGTQTFYQSGALQPIYFRVQAVTTNATTSLGGTFIQ
jgi:hypothetical protein